MNKEVILTRKRTIEEKIISLVSANTSDDAIAITRHLIEGHSLDWQYNRTLETDKEVIKVREVKSK